MDGLMIIQSCYLKKYGWMDGWMDGATGGVTPAKFSIFLTTLKAFLSPQEFSTRKTKDISRSPSIHPKENVRQLLYTKRLTYGVHNRYAEI
jgi:hypothetical protein